MNQNMLKTLSLVHTGISLSSDTKLEIIKIIDMTIRLFISNNVNSIEDVQNVVNNNFVGQLKKYALRACSQQNILINTYIYSTYINKKLKENNLKLDKNVVNYMSCIIDYLLSEIFELSGDEARNNKKV